MRYPHESYLKSKESNLGTQMLILENIKRQKRLINSSQKYSEKERKLIMKGLDLAFDRTWSAFIERDLL